MTLRCKWLVVLRIAFIGVLLMLAGATTLAYTQQLEPAAVKIAHHDIQIANITEQLSDIKILLLRQDDRIRSMEDSRNKIYGGLALITGLLVIMNGFMLMMQVREHLPREK